MHSWNVEGIVNTFMWYVNQERLRDFEAKLESNKVDISEFTPLSTSTTSWLAIEKIMAVFGSIKVWFF